MTRTTKTSWENENRIAFVIPAANEEDNIYRFCSALSKEIKKLNINAKVFFVVDDASKDKTLDSLRKISKKNKLFKVIYEPKNKNVANAYTRGYEEALKRTF